MRRCLTAFDCGAEYHFEPRSRIAGIESSVFTLLAEWSVSGTIFEVV